MSDNYLHQKPAKPPKQKGAYFAFLGRYAQIFKEVWSIRHTLDAPPRQKDELAFLPAHLELIETPVSPAPKWSARLIVLFAILTLIWAMVGQLDIVATATGKTTSLDRKKTISALETAKVAQILVQEGQAVKQGDELLILTQAGLDADITQNNEAFLSALATIAKEEALLKALKTEQPPHITAVAPLTDKLASDATLLASTQYQNWQLKDTQLEATLQRLIAQQAQSNASKDSLEQIYALEKQKLADYQALEQQNAISKHDYYTQQNRVLQLQNDLSQAVTEQKQLATQIKETQKQKTLTKQTLIEESLRSLKQATDAKSAYESQTQKAQERKEMMTLTAPTDGIVQELATHTIGGVVTPAQPLMVIAPQDENLEVEALIANKDIGFIKHGQETRIKLEAYPYTKYGYLTGKIKSLSQEAIPHEQLGLVYTAIITLDSTTLTNGKNTPNQTLTLSSGMSATIEIKTGKRRVIEYVLSPLQTKMDESLKER